MFDYHTRLAVFDFSTQFWSPFLRFRQCIGTYELAAMFVPVKRPSDLDSQNCAIKKALNIIGRSGSFGFTSSEVSSTIIHYFRHTGKRSSLYAVRFAPKFPRNTRYTISDLDDPPNSQKYCGGFFVFDRSFRDRTDSLYLRR